MLGFPIGVNLDLTQLTAGGTFSLVERPELGEVELAGGMKLHRWCRIVGISRQTAWRMRKDGKLRTVQHYGVPSIPAEEIKRFFAFPGIALDKAQHKAS